MEEKISWQQGEVGLGERDGKVEIGAWRHDPNVPDSWHVLLEKQRGKCSEGGVNSFGREHGNKCAQPMKMEGSEDVPGKFCQVHSKRDV